MTGKCSFHTSLKKLIKIQRTSGHGCSIATDTFTLNSFCLRYREHHVRRDRTIVRAGSPGFLLIDIVTWTLLGKCTHELLIIWLSEQNL